MEEACLVSVRDGNILKISGNVDFMSSDKFVEMLAGMIDEERAVTIDLSEVDLIDSRGLSGLVAAYMQARDSGVDIRLSGASDSLSHVLRLSGLAPVFGLAPAVVGIPRQCPDRSTLRRQEWRMTESVTLAEPELVAVLRDMAIEAARETGFDADALLDVRLAAGEALVNALRHGSKSPRSRIRLRCMSCPLALVIEVMDEGSGTGSQPNGDAPAGSCGLGTKLIKATMDEVEYPQTKSGFSVRMLKWTAEASEL